MVLSKRTLLVLAFCSTGALMSCGGDDEGSAVQQVTTTTADIETSTSDASTTSTTLATTTSERPAAAGGADSAEAALRGALDARSMGQNGRAWDLMLPSQRELLDRNAYLTCQEDVPFDIVGVEVIDEYPERIPVAGLGDQDSLALTVKMTIAAAGTEISQTDTFHALSENDRWYLSVTEEGFDCAKA